MDFPNTKAVQLTERIMKIFYADFRPACVPKLEVDAYNRVFEHVLRILEAEIKHELSIWDKIVLSSK